MSTYGWSDSTTTSDSFSSSFSPSPQSSKSTPIHSSPITYSSSQKSPPPPLPTVGERRQSKNNKKPMLVVYPKKNHHQFHHEGLHNNTIDGLLLASPPPTATKLPTSEMLKMPRLHQTFYFKAPSSSQLPSHKVGFAEYGDTKNGYPTFVLGGHGCTRLVGIMFEEIAQQHGLRMIWPERPGYGLSEEVNPSKLNVLDWVQVIIQLANHLNITTFSIIAQSVGTVFAMAIAHLYPSRIQGPLYLISPWVSTQQAGTFKWTRRLPARLVTRTLSFTMDIMWLFNNNNNNNNNLSFNKSSSSSSSSSSTPTMNGMTTPPQSPIQHRNLSKEEKEKEDEDEDEENEFLASLEKEKEENIQTDIPPHRPLRHMVRPRHVTLYVAMNKLRMQEPYHQGQLGDVLVALEKYHSFGFHYNQVFVAVSAVWGEKDQLIPQRAIDLLANQVHDIRLKILDGEAHDLIWKEGVMAWAIRGIGERWRSRQQQQQQPR